VVVGGMWLLYKQKIYIDKESNEPIEIELPANLRFKSNYPALALFVLGFFPLVYPFHLLSELEEYPRVVRIKLTGNPSTNVYPTLVYASVAPSAVTRQGDSFSIPVPFIGRGDEQYKVLLIANDHVLDSQTASKIGDQDITINFKPTLLSPPEYKTTETPVPTAYK
jgi:hypothetical protein